MLNKKNIWSIYSSPILQLISDIIAILLCYFVYYYIRFKSGYFDTYVNFDFSLVTSSAIVLLIYWVILLWFSGLYKNWYIRSPFDELFTIIRVAFFGSFLIFFFVFIDSSHNPRMLFLIYFLIILFLLAFGRTIARRMQVILRKKRIIALPTIIIGSLDKALELYEQTCKIPSWGFNTFGILLLDIKEKENNKLNNFDKSVILGGVNELHNILLKYPVKEVLIAVDLLDHAKLMSIVAELSDWKINIKIVPDMYDIFTGQVKTLHLYGIPLIDINSQLLKPWEAIIKRIFDITFSFLVIILGLPLWIFIGLLVKLESKGPIFYKQLRVGRNSKIFEIFKFRSMQIGSEKKGSGWTTVNDPRVTKVGKFIRKTHLDEIPQFWNVFIGDMSVVGPRPEQPKFVELFSTDFPLYKRRLKVRPGITGWWQIKYTTYELCKEEIENRLKDDFYYIENMSLKLDIEIIIRTVYCVITGHGQA